MFAGSAQRGQDPRMWVSRHGVEATLCACQWKLATSCQLKKGGKRDELVIIKGR